MQKTVLITGCASGIGYDAAHGLAKRGWRVFATCRQEADCERLRGEGLESFRLDYEDAESIVAGAAEALERCDGRLDALFNNGAWALPGLVEDLPVEGLRAIFEANLFGWHALTRAVLPAMRARGEGRIVNCSSVLGIVGMPWRGAYVATKFALEGLTDVLRMEMQGTGIQVVLIEPGPITSLLRVKSIPRFEAWIDWQGSVRAQDYAPRLERLYKGKKDRWELPASAVTAKLVRALESRNPRPRYMVTTPTYFAAAMKRLLWARFGDRIIGAG